MFLIVLICLSVYLDPGSVWQSGSDWDQMDLHEKITRGVFWVKDQSIQFWG